MKVTRYFQSCLLIEDGKTRLVIDPSGAEADTDFGKLDAVIYTHEHGDHFDADLAEKLKTAGAAVYTNQSTAKHMKSQPNVVSDNQEFKIGSLSIKARELPHCLMWDGSPGPQNTGYVIENKLFHSGDGVVLEGLAIDTVALPITGPDVSLKDAIAFAKQLSAKQIIPVHYDYIGTKPDVFASVAGGFDVHVLANGESADI